MSGVALLLLGLALDAPAPTQVEFRQSVEVNTTQLRMGDVADLSSLPSELRKKAATLPLMTLSEERRGVAVEHARLASRARALLPALGPWMAREYAGSLTVNNRLEQQGLAIAACGADGLKRGTSVKVSIAADWFRIEREIDVLQDAQQGQRFFGRTADGDVITAYCKGEKE